jgi:FtsP/CotA-like multicopper oxidase with cupredoxin domain
MVESPDWGQGPVSHSLQQEGESVKMYVLSDAYASQMTISNLLPKSLPQTSSGISLHFHGFYMWEGGVWSDGVAYLTQCPIAPDTSYTYKFKV